MGQRVGKWRGGGGMGVDPGEPKGMRTVPSQLTIVKSGYPCRIPGTPPNTRTFICAEAHYDQGLISAALRQSRKGGHDREVNCGEMVRRLIESKELQRLCECTTVLFCREQQQDESL